MLFSDWEELRAVGKGSFGRCVRTGRCPSALLWDSIPKRELRTQVLVRLKSDRPDANAQFLMKRIRVNKGEPLQLRAGAPYSPTLPLTGNAVGGCSRTRGVDLTEHQVRVYRGVSRRLLEGRKRAVPRYGVLRMRRLVRAAAAAPGTFAWHLCTGRLGGSTCWRCCGATGTKSSSSTGRVPSRSAARQSARGLHRPPSPQKHTRTPKHPRTRNRNRMRTRTRASPR